MPLEESLLRRIKQQDFPEGKLSLEGLGITDQDIDVLVSTIKDSPYFQDLQELNLSFNYISSVGAKKLAELSNLKVLDISSNDVDGTGVSALAGMNLQRLNISSNVIGDDIKLLASVTTLTDLIATECHITDAGAECLFQSKHIQKLDLSTNKIHGTSLARIENNFVLNELNLSQNQLCMNFFKCLSSKNALTSLNLTNIFIDAHGLSCLAENRSLRNLILTNCSIDDNCALILSKNTALERLVLSRNNITSKGVEFLAENNTLLYIDLSANSIISEEMHELSKQYQTILGHVFTRTPEFIAQLTSKKSADSSPGTSSDAAPLAASSPLLTPLATAQAARKPQAQLPSTQSSTLSDDEAASMINDSPRLAAFIINCDYEKFVVLQNTVQALYDKPPPAKRQHVPTHQDGSV